MKDTSKKILALLVERYPDLKQFRRKFIHQAAVDCGYSVKEYVDLIGDSFKVRKGLYDYSSILSKSTTASTATTLEAPTVMKLAAPVTSILNTDTYVPAVESTYVRWGEFADIASIIKSKSFYPVYIAGLSGNGKTMMVKP